ncbi:S41 family peptidase [Paenibacillus sp. 481]|uniref:S41 family peptidase n=1 Tax=Paenibacillus sp. 481 TaxID=2835869 RepID=UPI001E555A22|nr:S41 family peptidase [Paenibacillus sp. 481]UHA73706.1 S41 family peptidase [Paenibacillus sp. 481]
MHNNGMIELFLLHVIILKMGEEAMELQFEQVSDLCTRLAERIQTIYIFPEVADQLASRLIQLPESEHKDSFSNITREALFLIINQELLAISEDKHLRLISTPDFMKKEASEEDEAAQEARELAEAMHHNYGLYRIERLEDNIGYLDLRRFASAPHASESIAAAFTLLQHTDALIIDVRNNGGGYPDTVAFICSYLLDYPTHLETFYTRSDVETIQTWTVPIHPSRKYPLENPVYVLTSGKTFSAAEQFTYDLKNLKRATIVGEQTKGGAHPGSIHRMTDDICIVIPNGRPVSPITNTNWEKVGVTPDMVVSSEDALDVAYQEALRVVRSKRDTKQQSEQLLEA